MWTSINLHAQSVLDVSSVHFSSLTNLQQVQYAKVATNFGSNSIQKIDIGKISDLESNQMELLGLEEHCAKIKFAGMHVEYLSEQNYSWYGELLTEDPLVDCSGGHILIISKEGKKFGQLKLANHFFSIHDLDGLNIIIKQPTDQGHIEICGGGILPDPSVSVDGESTDNIQGRSGGNCDVDVLVLFTESAAEQAINPETFAQTSIAITNQALRNSDIAGCDLRFNLLGTGTVNISEIDIEPERILRDERIDLIELRDNAGADIVILFVNSRLWDANGTAGIAFLGPSDNAAVGISRVFGANNGFVFSHEMSHILGAHHEPCGAYLAGENCIEDSGSERAHTWNYKTGFWPFRKSHDRKTILYSAGGSDSDVIPNFSNPNVEVSGRVTGVEDQRDNASQLVSAACTVANFNQSPNEYLRVHINGPNVMCPIARINLYAEASGSPGPYTYEWKINDSGTNWNTTNVHATTRQTTFALPTGPSPDYNTETERIFIRLMVRATNGNQNFTYHSIKVDYNLLGIKSCLDETQTGRVSVYPNPSNGKAVLNFTLEERGSASFIVYNPTGSIVTKITTPILPPGDYEERLDLVSYGLSLYYIQSIIQGKISRLSMLVNHEQ